VGPAAARTLRVRVTAKVRASWLRSATAWIAWARLFATWETMAVATIPGVVSVIVLSAFTT
jgi:hypothetical protein